MNIKIVLAAIAAVVIVGGGMLFITGGSNEQSRSECADICRKANQTCPSLINEDTCNNKCSKLTEEVKAHLQNSESCQEISSKPDLLADLLIPEVETPEIEVTKKEGCEAACGSYVGKCLTLVPNATEALFAEGMSSCQKECVDWSSNKVDCMITAFDCEAMTGVCGL